MLIPALMAFALPSTPIETYAVDEGKTIYVDFSLQESSSGLSPVLRYGEEECKLVEEGDGIYKSESVINATSLSSGYFITCNEECIITVTGNSLITKPLYNYICINKDRDAFYGSYGNTLSNPGATAATQRVWLSNDVAEFYSDDEWDKPRKNAVAYLLNNTYQIVIMDNCRNSADSRDYYYADIPAEAVSCHFLRVSNNSGIIYEDNEVLFWQYGVCYLYALDGIINTVTVPKADADILGLVVEAYLTYGKLPSNGSDTGTVSNLFNTWFKEKSATAEDLKNYKIKDYSGEGYKDGEYHPEVPKTAEFSVNEKWNTMCGQAGIDPKTGERRNVFGFLNFSSSTWGIIGLVGVAAVVLLIGAILMLLKNKYRAEA